MQNLSYFLIILLLGAACSSGAKKQEDASGIQAVASEHIMQLTFDVQGMTCEGCEKAIKASIQKLDGIEEVTASHTAGESVVKFDSTLVSPALISEAIQAAGYEVTGFE